MVSKIEKRTAKYHRRGLWAIKAKHGGELPKFPKKEKPVEEVKPPKYYPAEDAPKPLKNRHKVKPTKLRSSITPGSVLILLAGRFKGKRVIFLKQLTSGLLLVTGPFRLNGVPLRRVDQAYVIATSTKVDISGIDVSKYDDSMFQKKTTKPAKRSPDDFFADPPFRQGLTEERKEDQKALDAKLISIVGATPELKGYLCARFGLAHGVKPHELVF